MGFNNENTPPVGMAMQVELSFLNHRLDVIDLWPDSPRKSATRHAIFLRLLSLRGAASSGNNVPGSGEQGT
jgi:hypothetical protein